MALSPEVQRILDDLQNQFGDKEITDADAELLYGGKASTFSKLCQRDKLQFAIITVSVNRDAIVEQYQGLAQRHNELIDKHKEALAVIQKFGNRKQRRHPWEGR